MTTPPPPTAPEFFGAMVESYDSLIHRAVPRYDEMTDRLVDYLPPAAMRILELGCGTGNLTLRLARRFPEASITTVDASPEMIDITRARFVAADASAHARVRFVTSLFENAAFDNGAFDLVTSCISLHHVRDKGPLFKSIYNWLAPGGSLRIADQLKGATDAIDAHNWRRWLDYCREPDNCTPDEIQALLDHAAAHDHYTPLHEHFALLAAAGFPPDRLDCVWRNLIWGVVTADRA